MNIAPINTLTASEKTMFEEMEILHKNLQKGVDRWFEKDLQQRGRTQAEMQEMTLNRPTERERGFFMITIDSYLNEAFDKLLERTCKDLIQKWSHEGGKRDFAIGVILETLKDQEQLDDEQSLKTSLQNVDDWKIIKKLMGLAAFMPPNIFAVYVSIIERGLKDHDSTKKVIIAETQLLLSLQLGPDVADEMIPAVQSIEDLQELKQVFIAAARAPNLGTFRQAHPALQNTEKVEKSPPAQH